MKLIIDIPEEDYNNIEPFLNDETINGGFNLFKALNIIKKGIPLEQKSCDMKQRVEKEYLYESLCEDLKKANAEIKRLSEPCDDAISRLDALKEMQTYYDDCAQTSEYTRLGFETAIDVVKSLPPINPQEPKYCDRNICVSNEYNGIGCNECEVTKSQKPKTGHWIAIDEEPHEDYECDNCGYTISTYTANIEPHTEYKYCPNCGCRMVEPQESEDKE